MKTIQASKFKAQCLALMDEVALTGEALLVTKNGRPIAELHPHRKPRAKSLLGLHAGQVTVLGDIISPLGKGEWNVLK